MKTSYALAIVLVILPLSLVAQEPAATEPAAEHEWLQKFVGTWDSKTVAKMGPDQPESVGSGKIKSEKIGEFWVINTISASMGGFKVVGKQTLGFDRSSKKFVGTWIDNMSDFIWHYEGSLDEAKTTLTLEAEGPDMSQPGKMALYRDVYEFVDDKQMNMRSEVQGPDGKWITFMTGKSSRVE